MITKSQFANTYGALIIGACILGTAHASEPVAVGNALSTNVQFGDLNLDLPAGARILYARLSEAARIVCSPLEGRDLATTMKWHVCYDSAISAAVAQIDKPMVTQLHDGSANRWQRFAAVDSATTKQSLASK